MPYDITAGPPSKMVIQRLDSMEGGDSDAQGVSSPLEDSGTDLEEMVSAPTDE